MGIVRVPDLGICPVVRLPERQGFPYASMQREAYSVWKTMIQVAQISRFNAAVLPLGTQPNGLPLPLRSF